MENGLVVRTVIGADHDRVAVMIGYLSAPKVVTAYA